MDQKVVITAPTTSACAAIASIELVTVSNIRMVGAPRPEEYPARTQMELIALSRNIVAHNHDCVGRK